MKPSPSETALAMLQHGATFDRTAAATGLTVRHVAWLSDCLLIDEAEQAVRQVVANPRHA